MRFGEYLISQGIIGFRDVLNAVLLQHERQAPLGQIALRHRFMSVRQVADVLMIEPDYLSRPSETGLSRMFGECAIELGYLQPNQVEQLLVFQINSRPPIGVLLMEIGALSQDELSTQLENFHNQPQEDHTNHDVLTLAP